MILIEILEKELFYFTDNVKANLDLLHSLLESGAVINRTDESGEKLLSIAV
jgi:hypothetical protein